MDFCNGTHLCGVTTHTHTYRISFCLTNWHTHTHAHQFTLEAWAKFHLGKYVLDSSENTSDDFRILHFANDLKMKNPHNRSHSTSLSPSIFSLTCWMIPYRSPFASHTLAIPYSSFSARSNKFHGLDSAASVAAYVVLVVIASVNHHWYVYILLP